jgi:PucR C-terminal helix-turn-helix domain/GGDEF-like domain
LAVTALGEALRERQEELERATLARVYGVSDPADVDDPEYVRGLRAAVSTGLSHGIEGIESSPERLPPVPPELSVQARLAARSGVALDTVLRRYFAGHALLGDFVLRAAMDGAVVLHSPEVRRAWRSEVALFDRLIATVATAYRQEADDHLRSTERRRGRQIRGLLAGELVETTDFDYPLQAWHLGAVAAGPDAKAALRAMALALGQKLLCVSAEGGVAWAWFGGHEPLRPDEVVRQAVAGWPPAAALALGEAGHGIEGWRLTHRQARAALPVAVRGEPNIVAYADVALLCSAIRDEVLAQSLHETYLMPLAAAPDGGGTLRETLRAYVAAGRNVTSAAAMLGVSRPTVKARLAAIEDQIGRSLCDCSAEIETALGLERLNRPTSEPAI